MLKTMVMHPWQLMVETKNEKKRTMDEVEEQERRGRGTLAETLPSLSEQRDQDERQAFLDAASAPREDDPLLENSTEEEKSCSRPQKRAMTTSCPSQDTTNAPSPCALPSEEAAEKIPLLMAEGRPWSADQSMEEEITFESESMTDMA